MSYSPLIQQLINRLCVLPGVGPKSAQRMAFHLLQRDREGGAALSVVLAEAMDSVGQCQQCQTLSEADVCAICRSPHRDKGLMCVVETPANIPAIEQAAHYNGVYFVLMGHLSPIDGIGPEQLGLDKLASRFAGDVTEVILATNLTVEGEATAHYIAQLAEKHQVKATRIAHGVPVGGELEYIDENTLSLAFQGRREL
ncbi:MAG: recombination protein RecR [Methylococcales bacterium]|nr:recombination protein RecR [Methylococcales bacterium]